MMNILDIRTVFTSFSISNAICAMVMAFLWRQNRKRSPELRFWLANFIMQFVTVLLIALRGILPDFISIVVANTLSIEGFILLYMGLQRFVNKVSSQRHNYVLLIMFFSVHTYFTFVRPSLTPRNANFSFAILLLCIQSAWLLIYRVEASVRSRTWKVGLVFIVFGLINLARILLSESLPGTNNLLQSGFLDVLFILSFQMLYLILSFALLLLVNRSLVAELEYDLAERKHMELSLQQRLLELETVNTLSISLRAGKNLEELLQILLKETLKTISGENGCILLVDRADDTLKVVESRGWFQSVSKGSFHISKGIAGQVFATYEPYISSDVHTDPLDSDRTFTSITPPSSGAFLPIRMENEVIGLLIVLFQLPRIVCENELSVLTIISEMAGTAISRCRLNDQIKVFNDHLQEEIQQKTVIQELLAAEKDLLSTTLMSIADGVVVTDKEGFVILFNKAAETITGYISSEAIEKHVNCVFRLQHATTLELVPDVINYLFELEDAQKKQMGYKPPQIMTRTGERILLSGSITSVKSPENKTVGFVIVFQNINEKHKAEAQKILSQKMEAIGQLAAGIAHEINTPIQYVGDNINFLGKAYSKYSEVVTVYRQVIQEHEHKPFALEDLAQLEEMACQKKIKYYVNEIPKAIQKILGWHRSGKKNCSCHEGVFSSF